MHFFGVYNRETRKRETLFSFLFFHYYFTRPNSPVYIAQWPMVIRRRKRNEEINNKKDKYLISAGGLFKDGPVRISICRAFYSFGFRATRGIGIGFIGFTGRCVYVFLMSVTYVFERKTPNSGSDRRLQGVAVSW